ncbi:ribosome recycling factor [Ruminococcus sp. NK3A76]|uniref:ribosome recycling factor n=1 Tax=Ruminococcus sp. NK3A76 TaxID=877411 RepID=UPI00056BD5A4|nr:ribosome recycling factor [Ruminococcus sp. NK3A76]
MMNTVINKAQEKMEKSINVLVSDYGTIRAGRANPGVLDKVTVDYYGTPTPINQLATVSVSEARVLVVQPWDKTLLVPIQKAIQASDIGINPQNDGSVLRLMFPQMTEEDRKKIVKDVKKMGEDTKVAVRSIRRDAMDKIKNMKKNNEITEDDVKTAEEKIQKLTDKMVKKVDETVAAKEKEVLSI